VLASGSPGEILNCPAGPRVGGWLPGTRRVGEALPSCPGRPTNRRSTALRRRMQSGPPPASGVRRTQSHERKLSPRGPVDARVRQHAYGWRRRYSVDGAEYDTWISMVALVTCWSFVCQASQRPYRAASQGGVRVRCSSPVPPLASRQQYGRVWGFDRQESRSAQPVRPYC
jgi:hypothetical protein